MDKFTEMMEYLKAVAESSDSGNRYLSEFSDDEKLDIIMRSKQLLAYASVSDDVNMSGKCYECKYRADICGDAHSQCKNILATVVGDEYGIKNGWFLYPFNFDPVWLRYCDGFEAKE